MPHSFTSLVTHVIFATKERAPMIAVDFEDDLHAYIGGIVRNLGGGVLAIDGWFDHRHVLAWHPPSLAVADLVRELKCRSTDWINAGRRVRGRFGWQSGYSAFRVPRSNIDAVRAYIANQEEHHRTVTFQEEWIAFLRKNEIAFDSKYICG
ncbi:MAG: transposase [Thermoanaerobaculia bacterium]